MTTLRLSQQRPASELGPPPSAEVLPFPQAKRLHFIAKTAARVAAVRTRQAGENILKAALDTQCQALSRRGVAPERIARQRHALECAIRARIWRLLLTPNTPHDAA